MLAPSKASVVVALLLACGLVIPDTGRGAAQNPISTIAKVDFERHVMGVLGKAGCNAGSCHGSFQGKGGFRLSLFGYDPEKDYLALTREALGRRVDQVNPERSLLLLKATGQVAHGGGRRFSTDTWQYELLRQWIVGGAAWKKGSGDVVGINITPSQLQFVKAGAKNQLVVKAKFTDGSEEDITPLCDYRVNDDAVAEVSTVGEVKSLRPGDTVVVVSYRGNLLSLRVLVPVEAKPGEVYPKIAEVNYIDKEVFAKLRLLNIIPADLSSDTEFLRRVTIDTIGCLPSPDDVRAFLADKDPSKRNKKIESLLAHPMHAALWATKFCDITGNNTDVLEVPREKRSKMWHDWFRKRVADNAPYDDIVRGVLCATSRDGLKPDEWIKQVQAVEEGAQKGFDTPYADRPSLDLFWRRQNRVALEQWGEKTAVAFMGVRLECAQCHKHPFDRWTQADYRSHANIFGQVLYAVSPECKEVIDKLNEERKKDNKGRGNPIPIREVFVGGRVGNLAHPDTNKPLGPKALGGPDILVKPGEDARVALFDWLRSPDNPYFARSFVNRVWAHYFGIGIVDPVDDFSLANPPSNEALLNALASDFIASKFDIRRLERTILNARAYHLASLPNDTNALDRRNYSRGYVRRMMAEVVVDMLNSALGVTEELARNGQDIPPGSRAIEVGPSRVQNQNLAYAFRIFGRSPRTMACDCERALEPALPQTLYLMTDQALLAKVQSPQGRLRKLIQTSKSDTEILDELFLATVNRFPTATEKQLFDDYLGQKKGNARQTAFEDCLWALINTREFILNH